MENETKAKLYKTAKALISCAYFRAGDYVAVKFYHRDTNGKNWFLVTASEQGKISASVAYHRGLT